MSRNVSLTESNAFKFLLIQWRIGGATSCDFFMSFSFALQTRNVRSIEEFAGASDRGFKMDI